jgi:hypothetical protein
VNRKWLCLALSVIVLLAVAATGCGGGDSGTATTTTVDAATTTTAGSVDTSGTTNGADTTQVTEGDTTTTAAASGGWVKVAGLAGSDTKEGEVFALSGKPARLSYKVTSTNIATIAAFYVIAEGTSLDKDGAIPEAMVTDSGEDSTTLTRDAGNYYLMVKSANCDWEFTVEEQQ